MCLILNVSGSRRLSYDRMEGPVGRSLSGTRTGRRRRARDGLGSRRCAAAARSRELRRGRIVAPPAPENPGWQREGRKQGGRRRRQPGGERRPPRRKRPREARTKTPSSDLPVRGSPSTSGCACVCGGGACARGGARGSLPRRTLARGGERAGGGGHPCSHVRYLKLALWSPSPPPPPGLWLLVVRVPPGLEGRPSALYFLRRDHLLTALSFRLNRTRGSPSPLPFPW